MAVGLKTGAAAALLGLAPVGAFANDVSMQHGLPARAVVAYVNAELLQGCAWQDIAAVGWREAGHGTYDGRHLDETTGVLTPALDKWDVVAMGGGPMGFLRTTWEGGGYAEQFPGEGDGGYQDMDAAAIATCQYLQAKGYDRADPSARYAALKAYNGTGPAADRYATEAVAYADGLPPLPAELGGLEGVAPTARGAVTRQQADALGGTGRRGLVDTLEAAWGAGWDWIDRSAAEHAPGGEVAALVDWVAPTDGGEMPAPVSNVKGGGPTLSDQLRLEQVGGFTVASGMANQLRSLLEAAERDGVTIRGHGFRSGAEQQALRVAHGCADPSIPAEGCSVPTARPGFSQHEGGLAIDVEGVGGAWDWLAANVEQHGLELGVPGEPWHVNVPRR